MTPEPDDIVHPDIANTAAVIVSYFPDDQFQQRLRALEQQFAAVFWVDNTPPVDAGEQTLVAGSVHSIATGENVGLASALNLGCRAASNAGIGWVVTFDQDSVIASDFLVRQIDNWRLWERRAFLLGCNYTDSTDKDVPRFSRGPYVRECRTVITSGSLMCLPMWSDLGEFRDDYFIDGVDHEICLRARAKGLLVARHGDVLMQHQIGQESPGFRLLPYVQPATRIYYCTRNGIRNIVQYASSDPLWAALKMLAILWESLFRVLLGPGRGAKFRAITGGMVDGVRGRMGPARRDYSSD